jgi:hypothetical protein
VPEISRFFGIVIRMFYAEHGAPHFHARYGKHVASIGIDPPGVLSGLLPPRAMGMALEWCALHSVELAENWRLLRAGQRPRRIPPLQ